MSLPIGLLLIGGVDKSVFSGREPPFGRRLQFITRRPVGQMRKEPWSNVSLDPISEEAIRALHVPNGHFRFSAGTYESGTDFREIARERTIYVLSGACSFTNAATGENINLCAQEFSQLPAGDYRFAAASSQPVRLIKVFLLPEDFRRE